MSTSSTPPTSRRATALLRITSALSQTPQIAGPIEHTGARIAQPHVPPRPDLGSQRASNRHNFKLPTISGSTTKRAKVRRDLRRNTSSSGSGVIYSTALGGVYLLSMLWAHFAPRDSYNAIIRLRTTVRMITGLAPPSTRCLGSTVSNSSTRFTDTGWPSPLESIPRSSTVLEYIPREVLRWSSYCKAPWTRPCSHTGIRRVGKLMSNDADAIVRVHSRYFCYHNLGFAF